MNKDWTNIVIAGLGGQGVIRASDILAEAAFLSGWDVKKSEIHGMSQRGGSVSSDIRFGKAIYSPVIPVGDTDYLVVIDKDQVEVNRPRLSASGILIDPSHLDGINLENPKTLNTAMLGYLSSFLPSISLDAWNKAMENYFSSALLDINRNAFTIGRQFRKEVH